MASTDSTANSAAAVTILGRTYHLRGDGDSAYLADLAALVDGKMREIAEGTGTADTLKVAILASLNLADDYLKARRRGAPAETDEVDRRLARMVSQLDEALAE
ncbi:MAG TPA: cell division protein ZapA [Candidatus Polarisedimenticolaceae bacterium]|nr:cell division protein ZapA [Candidatus Polarisedimenticolaceae bacterium]